MLEFEVKSLVLRLLRIYKRFVSPLLPPSCRFTPTCSQYTYEAVDRFGVVKGGWMGVKRVVRCNPFNPGGYDPVPFLAVSIPGEEAANSVSDHRCSGAESL